MVDMQAKRAFRYAGKRLEVGDPFTTKSKRDALLLEAAGKASRAEKVAAKEAKRRGTYKTASVAPAPAVETPVTPIDPVAAEGSRYYERRDMEPEQ
jgi:hypothetical protein